MTKVTPISLLSDDQKHKALEYAASLMTSDQFNKLRIFINELYESAELKK